MCINISGQIHQPGSLSRSMRTSRSSGVSGFTAIACVENQPTGWVHGWNMGISPVKIDQKCHGKHHLTSNTWGFHLPKYAKMVPKKSNKCEFDQPKWWFHPPFMVVFMGKWWRTMWFLGLSSNKAIISYHFHENSPTESLNHLKKIWRPVGSSPVGLVECPVSQGGISRILQDGDPQSLPYVCCFINTMKTSIHYSYSML